jgi:hypothetical protein
MGASDERLTWRKEHVDSTLEEHDTRIRRLEKGGLLVAGYLLAQGSNFVTELAQFL